MGERPEAARDLDGAIELLALLAVVTAVAHAIGPRRERELLTRLEMIATDWARPDADPALRRTSGGFLSPVVALLSLPAPRPVKRRSR